MAYIVDSAFSYNTAAGTALAQNMPPHQVGDILFLWVVVQAAGVPTVTTVVGTAWSAFVGNTTNATTTAYWAWKKAETANEIIALGTADDSSTIILCIRDVDATTPFDVSVVTNGGAATSTPVSDSVTTATADALVIYLMTVASTAFAIHSNPGVQHISSFGGDGTTDATNTSQGAAWYMQRAAGATPAPGWIASASGVWSRLTVAFRNKAGGIIPAYIDDSSTPATHIHNGTYIGTLNNTVVGAAINLTAVNGKAVSTAAAVAQLDLGIVPFSSGLARAAVKDASKAVLTGYDILLTGGRNFSTGLIMGSHIGATPKMGTFGMGSVADGGVVVRIGNGTSATGTQWCAYQVAARDAVPTLEVRSVWAIQAGYTGSSYGTAGVTAVDTTAVNWIQFLSNSPLFLSHAILSEVYQVFTQIVAGGTADFPVDTSGMATIGKSFRLPVIQKSGGAGLLSYVPIQIGGGDAVNFQIDAGALQFPRRYSVATKEIGFHADNNKVGISYAGKLGDVIKHTNSVITSPTPYYFNINAAATSAATWDFNGLVVVNGTVTLRPVLTFNAMTFSGCPSIDISACTLTNSTISKPPATSAGFVTSPTSVITSCSINTTTVTAGNWFTNVPSPSIFTSCTFTGSASSGHAIRIDTPGTYTLTSNTFTSYGADETTSAAIFNNSGGLVTINLAGGGSSPTVRNGAGASTVVAVSATLTIKIVDDAGVAITATCEVTVVKDADVSILYNVENVTTGTTAYAYSSGAGTVTYINIVNVTGYQPKTVNNHILASANETITVQLDVDRFYANP